MIVEENKEKAFIEFGNVFEAPIYKSEMVVGRIKIRFEQRFNWLNRLMFKIFFGIKITNIKEGS